MLHEATQLTLGRKHTEAPAGDAGRRKRNDAEVMQEERVWVVLRVSVWRSHCMCARARPSRVAGAWRPILDGSQRVVPCVDRARVEPGLGRLRRRLGAVPCGEQHRGRHHHPRAAPEVHPVLVVERDQADVWVLLAVGLTVEDGARRESDHGSHSDQRRQQQDQLSHDVSPLSDAA